MTCFDIFGRLDLGACYGITDDFEVGVDALPLVLTPEFFYANPSLGAMYRFIRGNIDVAGSIVVWLPVHDDVAVEPNLPVQWRVSPVFALRSELIAYMRAETETRPHQLFATLRFPLAATLNVTDRLSFTAELGLSFWLSNPAPAETVAVPLGFAVGYAVPAASSLPRVEPFAGVDLPALISRATISFSRRVWQVYAGVRVFLDTRS